jgi:hypothetical protein
MMAGEPTSFGVILCAPVAWLIQQTANYGLASYVCFPRGTPRDDVALGWNWVWYGMLAINVLALAVCIVAGFISVQKWRASNSEDPSSSSDVLEKGEGPAKYVDTWGYITSVSFLAAVLFNTFALLVVPMCKL